MFGLKPWPLLLWRRATDTNCMGVCGGLTIGLDILSERKFLTPTGNRTPNRPSRSLVTVPAGSGWIRLFGLPYCCHLQSVSGILIALHCVVCCVHRDASLDSRTRPSMCSWRPPTLVAKNVLRNFAYRRGRQVPRSPVRSVTSLGLSHTPRSTLRTSTTTKTRRGGSRRRCTRPSSTPTRSTLPYICVSTDPHSLSLSVRSRTKVRRTVGNILCTCFPVRPVRVFSPVSWCRTAMRLDVLERTKIRRRRPGLTTGLVYTDMVHSLGAHPRGGGATGMHPPKSK